MTSPLVLCWPEDADRAVKSGVVETDVALDPGTVPHRNYECAFCWTRVRPAEQACWRCGKDRILDRGPFPLRVAIATTVHPHSAPSHPWHPAESDKRPYTAIIAVGTITSDAAHYVEGRWYMPLPDVTRFATPIPTERETVWWSPMGMWDERALAIWQLADPALASRVSPERTDA